MKHKWQPSTGRFDLIIDTVPYVHDLNPYLPSLSINGTLVLVGYLGGLEPFLNTVPLIMGRKSVAGSLIGGIAETQEMLDFCGKHGITSDIEVIRIQDINAAYERMLKSDVKYRFVIDMASLKGLKEINEDADEQKSIGFGREPPQRRELRPVMRSVPAWGRGCRTSGGKNIRNRQNDQLLHRLRRMF